MSTILESQSLAPACPHQDPSQLPSATCLQPVSTVGGYELDSGGGGESPAPEVHPVHGGEAKPSGSHSKEQATSASPPA